MSNYLQKILTKYSVSSNAATQVERHLRPTIIEWGGNQLLKIEISGSISKGTAVSNGTDVDLFLSLKSTSNLTLNNIYESLYLHLLQKKFNPRKQNVSLGISCQGYKVDLVPARRQSQYGNDHSLFVSKNNTWVKTNIHKHISHVTQSRRQEEIRLVKIWRNLNNLDFPSLHIELMIIEALKYSKFGDLENNFFKCLQFIADNMASKRYVDPANTNNVISDLTSLSQKRRVAICAKNSTNEKYWSDIVW